MRENIGISFHNVDHSDALVEFIQKKSEVLNRFLDGSEHMNWVINVNGKNFEPHLDIALKGENFAVKSDADNAFEAVASVLVKAKRILSDRHGKRAKFH